MDKCWAVDLEIPGTNPNWGGFFSLKFHLVRKWTKWRTTRTRTTTRTSTQVIPWSLADGRRQKEDCNRLIWNGELYQIFLTPRKKRSGNVIGHSHFISSLVLYKDWKPPRLMKAKSLDSCWKIQNTLHIYKLNKKKISNFGPHRQPKFRAIYLVGFFFNVWWLPFFTLSLSWLKQAWTQSKVENKRVGKWKWL